MKSIRTALATTGVAALILSGMTSAASANDAGSEVDELVAELVELNPGATAVELVDDLGAYADEEGIPLVEALTLARDDAAGSAADVEESAAQGEATDGVSTFSGGGDVKLGPAQRVGDVFHSPSKTVVRHGHSGIYSSRTVVVEAPGPRRHSRSISASALDVKRGAKKQSVSISQTRRNAAANHSLRLRGKAYNYNFAANKKTNASRMNCSQLVWAAFKVAAKVDLDGNGGPGVYPSNIRDSRHTKTYRTL